MKPSGAVCLGARRMKPTLPCRCPAVNVDVWAMGMLASYVLPHGQRMKKREPYIVEVLFVPLPANEMEEKRRRLRGLLLTGAQRLARERKNSTQLCSESEILESLNPQVVPK
jgi:hypothetical protein